MRGEGGIVVVLVVVGLGGAAAGGAVGEAIAVLLAPPPLAVALSAVSATSVSQLDTDACGTKAVTSAAADVLRSGRGV